MRTAIAAAAFAAGALAVPAHRHQHKREVVYDYDYVTVTDVVTVTAGPAPTTEVSANANIASSSSKTHSWHHWWTWTSTLETSTTAPASTKAPSSVAPTSTEAPSSAAPTSQAPAPSSYKAPSASSEAPATTAAPTSTWVAPSSAAAPSTTSQPPASSVSGADASSYSGKVVHHHNLHRANHSAVDIMWDQGLADTAESIASSCIYAHNVDANGGGYGQNIAAGVEGNNVSAIITDLFYNGEVNWYNGLYGADQPDMTNFEHWGHFSQIVWKATTKVGCYTYDCTSKGLQNVGGDVAKYFTVCNYEPPGNYANEYGDNVKKPLKQAIAQWDS